MTKISAKASLTMIVLLMDYIQLLTEKGKDRAWAFLTFALLIFWVQYFFVGSVKAGAVLCIIGCLEASVAYPSDTTIVPTNCNNQKYLEILPDVPWGAKLPPW